MTFAKKMLIGGFYHKPEIRVQQVSGHEGFRIIASVLWLGLVVISYPSLSIVSTIVKLSSSCKSEQYILFFFSVSLSLGNLDIPRLTKKQTVACFNLQ